MSASVAVVQEREGRVIHREDPADPRHPTRVIREMPDGTLFSELWVGDHLEICTEVVRRLEGTGYELRQTSVPAPVKVGYRGVKI